MNGRRLLMAALVALHALLPARGQAEGQSYLVLGAGRGSQLDTYLSPMAYKGPQFTFLTGKERMTRWAARQRPAAGGTEGRVSFQQLLEGCFSLTDNPAKTASAWSGRLAYDAGWHYHLHVARGLTLKAGALLGADVGFLYNDRNVNNPAQGRASADLSLSAGGSYQFRLRRLPLLLRYQADMPLMGCMFSPQYGQSYYELSLGNRDHNVCFTHPGNALSFRQLLTLDLVFPRYSLRLGYLGDVRQSHVNHIRMHDIGHSFVLGYVRYFRLLRRAERKEVTVL